LAPFATIISTTYSMQFGLSIYFKKNDNIYYHDEELIDNEDFPPKSIKHRLLF